MRIYFLKILLISASIIFILRLFYIQIVNKSYETLSQNNAVIEISDYPERGLIYDRNSKLIVANKASYDLMVIPENINYFDTTLLCKLTKTKKKELIINLKKAKKFSKRLPSIAINQITKENYATLQEHLWKFKGFFIQKKSVRDYRILSGANVLGYMSEVNNSDLRKDRYYKLGELIGRQGIEKSYENELRGAKGKKFLQKDRFNRIIGSYQEGRFDIKKKNSKNITLTIDSDLQSYGEKIMKNKRGGIVAIEPQTGEILALISSPSYNPNLLIGKKRSVNYKILANDSLSKPLFDRGLQAQYPPGSPFKTLNALIGLQENVINTKTVFLCNKGYSYSKGAFMECHCKKGTRNNLLKGIYNSCNSFFAKTYTRIIKKYNTPSESLDNWRKHLESFGLGNYLGYDLPIGKTGFIPDSKYYNRWYKENGWSAPTIISNAIGQGEILTTPIQLANITAAIANRGFYYTPHFLKSSDSIKNNKFFKKNITSIDSLNFEIIIEGMHQVIEKGTAKIAKIKNIEVCGKTGTAENFTKVNNVKTQLTDHSIFIAFAPKVNPKIAIAVFIENGYWGSRWAAPIASLIIEKYINSKIERKWLEKKIMNGSLQNEYKKPYSGEKFNINE